MMKVLYAGGDVDDLIFPDSSWTRSERSHKTPTDEKWKPRLRDEGFFFLPCQQEPPEGAPC